MEHSILREVNKKTMGVYLAKRTYNDFYFPRFFPFLTTPFLTYETIVGSKSRPVAADVVAYDASAPLKTRKVVSKLTGDIPPIRMKKKMSENDLNLYNILTAMGRGKSDFDRIMDLVFGDMDACVEGCLARMEWLALQALFNGVISLTADNNAGIVTEEDIDFQMAAARKRKIASATSTRVWNNGTTSNYLPITDIRTVVDVAKTAGITLQYILMNYSKWSEFAVADEVKQLVHPFWNYGGAMSDPTKDPMVMHDAANRALKAHKLPQIIIIDTYTTVETEDHVQTTGDPTLDSSGSDANVVFIPQIPLGNMMVGPLADETNPPKQATQVKKGNILVQKYSTVDPVNEFTRGAINAFPSFYMIDDCYRLDTEATPEADGLDD